MSGAPFGPAASEARAGLAHEPRAESSSERPAAVLDGLGRSVGTAAARLAREHRTRLDDRAGTPGTALAPVVHEPPADEPGTPDRHRDLRLEVVRGPTLRLEVLRSLTDAGSDVVPVPARRAPGAVEGHRVHGLAA